jgi:hypothetical protein
MNSLLLARPVLAAPSSSGTWPVENMLRTSLCGGTAERYRVVQKYEQERLHKRVQEWYMGDAAVACY